jgi:uncharacterized protein (TIGR00255 family)
MIQSMTGYGKYVENINNKKVTVEIKSLNSKSLDLNVRIPSFYREKELELRTLVGNKLTRGKVDFSIYIDMPAENKKQTINQEVVTSYFNDLTSISEGLSLDIKPQLFELAMKLPDVLSSKKEELDPKEWTEVVKIVENAIVKFQDFRNQEGNILENEISSRINNILNLLTQVEPFEQERIDYVRNKMTNALEEKIANVAIDMNRLEQELIYFIEKLDITEEKVRLKGHCDYFLEVINKETNQGKKLGFIGQEIGREINTLGSKANHQEMQKIVVQMKDELEKLKEQILNTL